MIEILFWMIDSNLQLTYLVSKYGFQCSWFVLKWLVKRTYKRRSKAQSRHTQHAPHSQIILLQAESQLQHESNVQQEEMVPLDTFKNTCQHEEENEQEEEFEVVTFVGNRL